MSAEVRDRIFDPYYTTRTAGSGLGLATSYWIVSRHGGRITVSSEPGHGATFHVWLPTVEGRVVRSQRPQVAPVAPQRVLVMDDEPAVLRAVCSLLGQGGHAVEGVAHGALAIEAWQRAHHSGQPFDLALLDLSNAAGMGGLDTLQALHGLDPAVKAVVMSGYTDGQGMVGYREHGFVARLEKPFGRQDLERALSQAFEPATGPLAG